VIISRYIKSKALWCIEKYYVHRHLIMYLIMHAHHALLSNFWIIMLLHYIGLDSLYSNTDRRGYFSIKEVEAYVHKDPVQTDRSPLNKWKLLYMKPKLDFFAKPKNRERLFKFESWKTTEFREKRSGFVLCQSDGDTRFALSRCRFFASHDLINSNIFTYMPATSSPIHP
jgi:hypothetical protein